MNSKFRNNAGCELCVDDGKALWQDALCRVVRVGGAEGEAFPGFCRVIWKAHVAEMTALAPDDRRHLMNVVFATEAALRALLRPDKINLASLGNVVPHLHWHVIPRWRDDSHFPLPIWREAQRAVLPRKAVDGTALAAEIATILSAEVSGA
jgi:diadenosine tetraphosphate (Ap4A) HIT family hydrolase